MRLTRWTGMEAAMGTTLRPLALNPVAQGLKKKKLNALKNRMGNRMYHIH